MERSPLLDPDRSFRIITVEEAVYDLLKEDGGAWTRIEVVDYLTRYPSRAPEGGWDATQIAAAIHRLYGAGRLWRTNSGGTTFRYQARGK